MERVPWNTSIYAPTHRLTILSPAKKKPPQIPCGNPNPSSTKSKEEAGNKTPNGPKMSLSKSESDIILNRANVALSRSQRLVSSWLPAQTDEELASSSKTDEELQREEDEIFTAVPET